MESREFTQLYALHLYPENITEGGQKELKKLEGKNFTKHVEAFINFIEKYGIRKIEYLPNL